MISLPPLRTYEQQIADLPKTSLRVTAHLLPQAQIAAYDPIHLDNLLAWAVLQDVVPGGKVPNSEEPYDLPLPLDCLWRNPSGLPLWASSVFRVQGQAFADTVYWHKRAQTGRWTFHPGKGGEPAPMPLKTTAGRFMERRVPMPTALAEDHAWVAECVGNAEEVCRLLQHVAFLGKKRGIGMGEVDYWEVEEVSGFTLLEDGCLTRPVPLNAAAPLGLALSGALSLVGWTPPQWQPALFEAGWPAGTAA